MDVYDAKGLATELVEHLLLALLNMAFLRGINAVKVGVALASFSLAALLASYLAVAQLYLLPVLSPLLLLVEALVQFAVLFVLGLLVVSLFPRRLEAVAGSMVASPWKSVLAGLLGTVAMPVLLILLIVTVIGILLVPVQILAMAAAGVLGTTALTFHLGRSLPLPQHRRTTVLHLALGTAIFVVVTHIPVLGAMAWIATWLLTFGAVLRSRFGSPTPVLPTTIPPSGPPPAPAA